MTQPDLDMRDQDPTPTPGRDALALCLSFNVGSIICMTKTQEAEMPAEWQLRFKDLQAEYTAVFPNGLGMHPDSMVKMDDLWQATMTKLLNEYLLHFQA